MTNSTFIPLVSGSIAGMSVDMLLFPIDTLKTRLQSTSFYGAGGFRNIYKGISSQMIGSAPSAALFFLAYESSQEQLTFINNTSLIHMLSASIGEVCACIFRVPMEVVKQRMQVGSGDLMAVAKDIYGREGIRGFYRGFSMTCFREIPFACIQFPFFEFLKNQVSRFLSRETTSIEASLCGFVAGGTAAALTTPLDCLKTRIMLSKKSGKHVSIPNIARQIFKERGARGFIAGIGPRVMWISIGGSVFLGMYDACKKALGGV